MMFHAKDGWFFQRLEDGSVGIKVTLDGREPDADRGNLVASVVVPPGTWASVCATVSRDGENAETFELYLNGQKAVSVTGRYDSDGRPEIVPAYPPPEIHKKSKKSPLSAEKKDHAEIL